jgi:magnesium-transporting ATPase (P-type)
LAKLALKDREEEVAAVDEKIEVNLELIGSTAIEDRLQDKVADTIQFMKSVGIKVWVLTGDKIETAINIGISAGLLDNMMQQHIIDENEVDEIETKLKEVTKEINEPEFKNIKKAIIVAGASLVTIDGDQNLLEMFLEASDNVDVVLACRVSPK